MDAYCLLALTWQPSASTGFMRLPRELRDLIYELALVAETPISILNFTNPTRGLLPVQTLGINPALLVTLVSKTLYKEASQVLYGLNTYQARIKLNIAQARESGKEYNRLSSFCVYRLVSTRQSHNNHAIRTRTPDSFADSKCKFDPRLNRAGMMHTTLLQRLILPTYAARLSNLVV